MPTQRVPAHRPRRILERHRKKSRYVSRETCTDGRTIAVHAGSDKSVRVAPKKMLDGLLARRPGLHH